LSIALEIDPELKITNINARHEAGHLL